MVLHEGKHFEAADPGRGKIGRYPSVPLRSRIFILTSRRLGNFTYAATKTRLLCFISEAVKVG